jgi:archaellum component FlaC
MNREIVETCDRVALLKAQIEEIRLKKELNELPRLLQTIDTLHQELHHCQAAKGSILIEIRGLKKELNKLSGSADRVKELNAFIDGQANDYNAIIHALEEDVRNCRRVNAQMKRFINDSESTGELTVRKNDSETLLSILKFYTEDRS